MKTILLALLVSALTTLYLAYPEVPKTVAIDVYAAGVEVNDSLRILEDDNALATQAFVADQQALTEEYMASIPNRAEAVDMARRLGYYDRYGGLSITEKGAVFYLHNPGGEFPQARLYRKANPAADEMLIFDPVSFDSTTSLAEYAVSDDEQYVALAMSRHGSDWRTVRILNMANGTLLPDSLNYVKFSSLAWYENGLYYNGFPPTEEFETSIDAALKYHALRTPQSADEVIMQQPEDPYMLYGAKVKNKRWLIIETSNSTSNNALYIKDLEVSSGSILAIRPVVNQHEYQVLGIKGNELFIQTNEGAENNRIVKVDLAKHPTTFQEVIAEHPAKPLTGAWLMGDELMVEHLDDATSSLSIYDLKGRLVKPVAIPPFSTLTSLDAGEEQAVFTVESFLAPAQAFVLDKAKGYSVSSLFEVASPLSNPGQFEVSRIQASSKDGTPVRAFVVAKKGRKRDGNNPTLLYGYGGFNISITPRYRALFAAWLEAGGTLVVANLRGGGEYGHTWHRAGTKTQKQHVFDDFIAVAEYLINERYTRPELLAINGASNGGLLVAATMLQRPELFGVALPQVGVMDMLRYNTSSGGALWEPDYGNPQVTEELVAMLAYSPVHNVRPASYPATLITTGLTDTRVAPWHSFKLAGLLQAHQQALRPVLIRIDNGGHGPGRTVREAAQEVGDMLAFTLHQMGRDWTE